MFYNEMGEFVYALIIFHFSVSFTQRYRIVFCFNFLNSLHRKTLYITLRKSWFFYVLKHDMNNVHSPFSVTIFLTILN